MKIKYIKSKHMFYLYDMSEKWYNTIETVKAVGVVLEAALVTFFILDFVVFTIGGILL